MVKLFYATPNGYANFQHDVPSGRGNPGGGMPMKTLAVTEAWGGFYDVVVGENVMDYHDADILVIEPLWFRLRGDYSPGMYVPDLDEAVEQYETHPASIKVMYASELSFVKLPLAYRSRIIEASTVVTTNCHFQRGVFEMLGIETVQLTDPVRESVFYSANENRELAVFAMGRISTVKNSLKIAEIFQVLRDKPIKTVYIGSAALWGSPSNKDERIERKIGLAADECYSGLSSLGIGRLLAKMSCGIFDTFHDSASTSNMESMMAGVYCFFGLHETWRGRPGVHDLDTVDDFVGALADATGDFTRTPDKIHYKESSLWALENYSQEQFLDDWSVILRNAS